MSATPHPRQAEMRQLSKLAEEVRTLVGRLGEAERQFASEIDRVDPRYRESARNLVHYIAIRQVDLRPLQEDLARWGLSSIGRMEGHVEATLAAVLSVLERMLDVEGAALQSVAHSSHRDLVSLRTADLFGPPPKGRHVRVMVTLPADAADEHSAFVRRLLEAGTDCVRINCAKDDREVWDRLIEQVRQAERDTGRACRILMDLAGAKPRTGSLRPGPEVAKWKPKRDVTGKVVEPARIAFAAPGGISSVSGGPAAAGDLTLVVDGDWLAHVRVGDRLRRRDARSKKRGLRVVERTDERVVAESEQTGYVLSGTKVTLKPAGNDRRPRATHVHDLPPVEEPIHLHKGDALVLTSEDVPGRPAAYDAEGRLVSPARIACTAPEIFSDLRVGEPVRFDDGKIEGVIESISAGEVTIRITLARERGSKLRADRGINFPESRLRSRGLTEKDRADLEFVVRRAEMVGLSFAESEETVRALQDALAEQASGTGIVLKVETQRGFNRLPRLLLEAMRTYPIGVMIARGDLAVECGWERTAEVQEEILWMCEAAHVPVIWATQVLEGLTKSGIPSRAEITDAAMAERAECVMLNKGPYILEAVRSLGDVLERMEGHQAKKMPLLRHLHVSDGMMGGPAE